MKPFSKEMSSTLQTWLIAVIENNNAELYANLNLLTPNDLTRGHIVLAGHLAKTFCWEGVYLFNAMLLRKFRCPAMVYSDIFKKLSRGWQRHLPQLLAVHRFSEDELARISTNLFIMHSLQRVTLVTAALTGHVESLHENALANLFLGTRIPATAEHCKQTIIAMLEDHALNFAAWYDTFVKLLQHESIQIGAKLIAHLMENGHLTKTNLSALPWGTWLERAFRLNMLTEEIYLRMQYLGFNLIIIINQMPKLPVEETKVVLRKLTSLGCNIQDNLLQVELQKHFKECYSLADVGHYQSLEILYSILQAAYIGYVVAPPYESEIEYHLAQQQLMTFGVIDNLAENNAAISGDLIHVLTRPDRKITQVLFSFLDNKSIRALACVCRVFYQNCSRVNYPSTLALETTQGLHLEWIRRVEQVQIMHSMRGYKNPIIQLIITPFLIISSGIAVCVAGLYHDKENASLLLILLLGFLGSLLAAVLLTVVYRIFPSPLRDYFPGVPQYYLAFSENLTAEFLIKVIQLHTLTIDLHQIYLSLNQRNEDTFSDHLNCIDTLNLVGHAASRIVHCFTKHQPGLLGERCLEVFREEMSKIDSRAHRTEILRLHRDLNDQNIRWGDNLERGSMVRQCIESYQPNFFQKKTPLHPIAKFRHSSVDDDNDYDDKDTTPLFKSTHRSYHSITN